MKRKPKESNFVRFMNSLQNRGPLTMHNDIYTKWTTRIRAEMEEAGSWPTGMADCHIGVAVEYVSRLQRSFWDEFPDLNHQTRDLDIHSVYNGVKYARLLHALKIFAMIYNKIRGKGMRERIFFLKPLCYRRGPHWTYVDSGPDHWRNNYQSIGIWPYQPPQPFNDHGAGI